MLLGNKNINFPGPTGTSKCPSDPQLIDQPTENLLFATLIIKDKQNLLNILSKQGVSKKFIFSFSVIFVLASVSIYCGNLDDDIDENDLKTAFEVFGEIL